MTLQTEPNTCGIHALAAMIARHPDSIRPHVDLQSKGTSLASLIHAASTLGIKTRGVLVLGSSYLPLPSVLHTVEGARHHWVTALAATDAGFRVFDPADGLQDWTYDRLAEVWDRIALIPDSGFNPALTVDLSESGPTYRIWMNSRQNAT